MIKVLVVDDSPTAKEMIATILSTDKEIKIIGKASNGQEAIDLLESNLVKPDIITTDINMPVMDGFEMIKYVMAYHPVPILIVTMLNKDANFMKALNLGALDIIEKPAPSAWNQLPKVGIEIIEKVKLLSRVKVITHLSGKKNSIETGFKNENGNLPQKSSKIVCITSSTGGPNTLVKLLKNLPKSFPCPIFIVQHMSESFFIEGMVEWFKNSISLDVTKAQNAQFFSPGCVYISPAKKHMIIDKDMIRLQDSDPVNNQKPSADILFKSASKSYGKDVIALVLTGIGDDGADGIRTVYENGGYVMAQDEQSSLVYGMPKAAIDTDCVKFVDNEEGLAKELLMKVSN